MATVAGVRWCPDGRAGRYRKRWCYGVHMSDAGQGSGAESVKAAVLGYDAAAAYIGMKRSWLEHSDVPRVKLGRRVVFRIVDLDDYLKQRAA